MPTAILRVFDSSAAGNEPPPGQALHFAHFATAVLTSIIRRPEFAQKVLSWPYGNTRRKVRAGQYVDRTTPADILRIIMEGVEMGGARDTELDLHVKLGKKPNKIVGSAVLGGTGITTNVLWFRKFLDGGGPVSLAAHWMHEWMHNAGFTHTTGVANDAKSDVPYSLGRIVPAVVRGSRELASEIGGAEEQPGELYLSAGDSSCELETSDRSE